MEALVDHRLRSLITITPSLVDRRSRLRSLIVRHAQRLLDAIER
jgi:hypothetical protein